LEEPKLYTAVLGYTDYNVLRSQGKTCQGVFLPGGGGQTQTGENNTSPHAPLLV